MADPTTIRAIHAALTVETLEALANKGLVRRAQKDLERGEVKPDGETVKGVSYTVSGNRVQLVEAGPAKASCSCPAAGVCQHIIAACLMVMQSGMAAETVSASARDEWLALSNEEVVQHYGMPVMRAAHELLSEQTPVVSDDALLRVRFPLTNAEARGVAGAGIAGIIISDAPEKQHPVIAAAAVLQVRRLAGQPWEPVALKPETATAPLSRDEVLRSTQSLLAECVANGLARLAPQMAQRFESLGVSAQGAALPRLALLLQRLATQVDDWLARRPHADLARLLGDLALGHALSTALMKDAKPHLVGTARESYADVMSLDLVCVAGWPWRTASGYEGLTLLFWDNAGKQWNTWTDARPKSFLGGFNAVTRWTQPGPWEGADSPSALIGHTLRLMRARRNRWGRLSSSSQTRALVAAKSGTSELGLTAVTTWQVIESSLADSSSLGLRERDPRQGYQLVKPARWERQPFDPVAQTLSWLLADAEGRALLLRVPYDELNKPLISALERLTNDELHDAALLVRCHRSEERTVALPLALINASGIKVLAFDKAASSEPPPLSPPSSDSTDTDESDDNEASSPSNNATTRWANALISDLEWIAESGTQSSTQVLKSDHRIGAKHLGLAKLEALANEVLPMTPERLLRLRWIAGRLL